MFEPQGSNGPSALTDFPREVYMSFRSHVWGAAFGVAGLALFLSACSSSTAPVSLSDPVATAAQLAALDSAFAAHGTVASGTAALRHARHPGTHAPAGRADLRLVRRNEHLPGHPARRRVLV